MKHIYRKISGVLCTVMLVVLFACQKENSSYKYFRTDYSSYMFKSDGSDTCNILIESNVDWSIVQMPEWVSLCNEESDNISLVAQVNDSNEMREGNIVFSSEAGEYTVVLSQFFNNFNGRFYDLTEFSAPIMSRNGMYIVGMKGRMDENGAGVYTPVIINTRTGEREEWEPTYDLNGARYISNDGRTVVLYENYSGYHELYIDKEKVDVRLPEGYYNFRIYSASEDGVIWVGYCQDRSDGKYYPVRWTNGEPELLDMPEANLFGQDVSHNGTMARGCNADGSVIYGTEWDSRGLVYWKDGIMNFIGGDPAYNILGHDNPDDPNEITSYTGIVADASTVRMSPNGRYISTAWYSYFDGYMVTMIDIETGNVEIIESLGDSGGETVDNDGNFFAGVPYKSAVVGYRIGLGEDPVPVTDWLESVYGLKFVDGYMVKSISEDGRTIFGARAMNTVYGVMYSFWCVATDVFEE